MHSQVTVHKHSLSNGLTILSIPSRQVPVVSLQGWIRFGSADETDDIAGVAHLFEHLLFKGTKNRAVGQIAREVEGLGGDLNAYTTYDHTVMHMTLPSRAFTKGLEILADALLNSTVEPDELERERPVILEEIKRRNDMPGSIASDLLRSKLFSDHPYARPVIGYASVVEKISREKIVEQYKRHYNAANLFLVISGDFDEAQMLDDCENYFSSLAKGSVPPSRGNPRALSGHIENFKRHPVPDTILNLGWQAPQGADLESAAMDALALIIGQGESSRLYRKLVLEEKLLREIGAGCWSPKDLGSFVIGMRGSNGTSKNFPEILQSIHDALVPNFTPAELEKAKRNLLSSGTYSKETVDGLAQRFGYFESIASDWSMDAKYLKAVEALTIDDLENAKKKYLGWNQAVMAGIVPEKEPLPVVKIPVSPRAKKEVEIFGPSGAHSFNFRGLKVIVKTMKHLPIFSLRWVGLGGMRTEIAKKGGLGSLWARTVTSGGVGTDGRLWTRKDLNEFIDLNCASMSAFHGRNSFGFQVDGLSQDFESLTHSMLSAYHQPTFAKDIVEHEKSLMKADYETMKDSPGSVVSQLFSENMFGAHAYGRSGIGTPPTIRKLTQKDLLAHHKTLLKEPQVLTVVGDVSTERVKKFLEEHFNRQTFPKKSSLSKKKAVRYPKKSVEKRTRLKKEQTHILMGIPTCTVFEKDRWALLGLSSVLSGQGGRLFVELRDKMSLCYTVSPTHMEGLDGGYFGFYIATSPEKEQIAKEALFKEIDRLRADGVTSEEWQKALNFYVGNYQIDQQRLSTQSTGMALDELYGFGFEDYFLFEKHLSKITAEDISRVTKKYFPKDFRNRLVVASVGPSA